MLKRLIKDPIALAIALTAPCLFVGYHQEWTAYGTQDYWAFGFLFASRYMREDFNLMALAIIWTIAIIRWKWQKEDKAKQG